MKRSQTPPLVMSGLVLGTLSLGNFLRPYFQPLGLLFVLIAFLLYLLLLKGMLRAPKKVMTDLQNPLIASVFASVFPTFLWQECSFRHC
ncbi:hypothetical protein STRIC_0578 [Streptococcus ictaluri 707-05]|uniref:C4-dicarboxylate transporter/malic acid transport domain protein n=1 Tax=Streptococcus ictaluri 707-05 TaxID=764299 RepID=G5K691_9STRE|nr:hypothetical protein STRIC_0578 [Streptococcus ictaluri 707-05]